MVNGTRAVILSVHMLKGLEVDVDVGVTANGLNL